jgi:nucleotide-binding universal stress UspA family protein
MHLLVAFDDAGILATAVERAVAMAREDNYAITLMCVVPDVIVENGRWAWPGIIPGHQGEVDASGLRLLHRALSEIPIEIPVRTVLRRGHLLRQAKQYAREHHCDAVLVPENWMTKWRVRRLQTKQVRLLTSLG